jgi:hypothetical protein
VEVISIDSFRALFLFKIAATLDEACKLLETGFEYVTDMDGKQLFRKRK